ncbi:arginase family protein [Sporolactobacillus shoreicorticis]|uniref:Arginase family protein n=1 Tax=Sporolactobacillus shoreicorticis TaxID=1923877 RepID=A0ABW5S4L7_9BACL|nr:arginase family protein [Sporolactobacillus shoreicorticis]MCO7125814.1 arginase family protein [Sporolactobacillus shoreicorticis]
MTLLHHDITFCNFDNSYKSQPRLLAAAPHHWIDFTQLRGTHLYCSPEAFTHISDKLSTVPDKGLTFWGSGNYHYATLAMLKNIHRPFSLVLFDHHTDLQEGSIGSMLSCGSWVRHAISQLANLRGIAIIGPESNKALIDLVSERCRAVLFPEERFPTSEELLSVLPTKHIYVSIDKDLLSENDAKTNWDQGTISLDKIVPILDHLIEEKYVEGLDVCGEWPVRPHQQLNQQTRTWISRNERSNQRIARAFMRQARRRATQSKHAI